MSIAKTATAVVIGLEGRVVEVEAVVHPGPPDLHVIGLPDQVARSCRDRVRAAAVNSEVPWPPARHVTVSLLPVSMPKPGSALDLAIAVSMLAATGALPTQGLSTTLFLAELGLDGAVRPVRGVLPAVRAATDLGVSTVVVAPENAAEAAVVDGVRVLAPRTLGELVDRVRNSRWLTEPDDGPDVPPAPAGGWTLPWTWLKQRHAPQVELAQTPIPAVARRAVEVAAAGGHDVLLFGRPEPAAGYAPGRVPVAVALAALLPPLDQDERLTAATMSSLAGVLDPDEPLTAAPAFQAPHHTVTAGGLTGRMTPVGALVPGAMLLAYHGVLLIEDAPEFDHRAMQTLHRALTSQQVRLYGHLTHVVIRPRFQLVLGVGMCPCENIRAGECSCPPVTQRRYRRRIQPLVDDLPVKVSLNTEPVEVGGESTAAVARRVQAARDRARARLADTPWTTNAQVPAAAMIRGFLPDERALELLDGHPGSRPMSILNQVLQVAWTVADLAGLPVPGPGQIREALALHRTPVELAENSTAPEPSERMPAAPEPTEPGATEPER